MTARVHVLNGPNLDLLGVREPAEWRAKSIMTAAATGMITGLGIHGYALAVEHVARRIAEAARTMTRARS